MTLGRFPLSNFCPRGTPPVELTTPESVIRGFFLFIQNMATKIGTQMRVIILLVRPNCVVMLQVRRNCVVLLLVRPNCGVICAARFWRKTSARPPPSRHFTVHGVGGTTHTLLLAPHTPHLTSYSLQPTSHTQTVLAVSAFRTCAVERTWNK